MVLEQGEGGPERGRVLEAVRKSSSGPSSRNRIGEFKFILFDPLSRKQRDRQIEAIVKRVAQPLSGPGWATQRLAGPQDEAAAHPPPPPATAVSPPACHRTRTAPDEFIVFCFVCV